MAEPAQPLPAAREGALRTLAVTLGVCGACALLVASSVVWLRPIQRVHQERERGARVLAMIRATPGLGELVAGLEPAALDARMVDLASGRFADELDAGAFDLREAAQDPERSISVAPERDLARISRRPIHAPVYLVRDAGRLQLLILPVYGRGYISTLWGYVALDADLNTIRSLDFYAHGETPGLGAEIESPAWRAQWVGVRVRDPQGEIRLRVARGPAARGSPYEVDGIAGATRTGAGVADLLHFWLGSDGFGPFLAQLRAAEAP